MEGHGSNRADFSLKDNAAGHLDHSHERHNGIGGAAETNNSAREHGLMAPPSPNRDTRLQHGKEGWLQAHTKRGLRAV